MISGNASAQTQAEADHLSNGLEWFCEGSDQRESDIAKFPTGTCDQHLQVSLRFPNCVNPDNLAEYDWSDDSNKCPEGMKAIPQIRYAARYDTSAVVPGGWSGDAPFQLSCGSAPGNGYCFHGDFINGWYEDAAESMLTSGGGAYEDGQFISGEHGSAAADSGCTPTDQDPDNGTAVEMISGELVVAGAVKTSSAITEAPVQPTTLAPATTPIAASTISRRRRIKTTAT